MIFIAYVLNCQLLHIVSFFLFVAGFIYSHEAGQTKAVILALFSLGNSNIVSLSLFHHAGLNIAVYVARIVYEFTYMDFHPLF